MDGAVMDRTTNIQYLKGVGEKRAKLLGKLGIFTVGDLLRYYPREYTDWSKVTSIAAAPFDEPCCVKATVDHKPRGAKVSKGMTIYKTVVTDGESLMNITIFNSKYTAEALEAGEEYLFYGKVGGNFHRREMSSPLIEKASSGERIHSIYHLTAGVNSKYIEKLIRQVFSSGNDYFTDCLPQSLRDKLCLMEINKAIHELHLPTNEDMLHEARRRIIFEELFIFQLGLMKLKGNRKETTPVAVTQDYTDEFKRLLPFRLTGAQNRAVSESISQMTSGITMNRLLQGDVGSGKTAVAAALIYTVVKNGYQCAFMAPTEILAQQHFITCQNFFKDTNIHAELLTGSVTAANKRAIKERLKSGETRLIIGTHALIQDDVEFSALGLVITDEQHRFGVKHRAALSKKETSRIHWSCRQHPFRGHLPSCSTAIWMSPCSTSFRRADSRLRHITSQVSSAQEPSAMSRSTSMRVGKAISCVPLLRRVTRISPPPRAMRKIFQKGFLTATRSDCSTER